MKHGIRSDDIIIEEMCQLFYPHPDAPDVATISVFRFLPIKCQKEVIPTILQCIDTMQGLDSITTLDSYNNER